MACILVILPFPSIDNGDFSQCHRRYDDLVRRRYRDTQWAKSDTNHGMGLFAHPITSVNRLLTRCVML